MNDKLFFAICGTISTVAILAAIYFTVQTTQELKALEVRICAMNVDCED